MDVVQGPDSIQDCDRTLDRLVAQFQAPLLRICYIHLHDQLEAQDAVQETFMKAYRNLGSFRGESSEKTWLIKIAVNTCRDMQRSGWFRHMNRRVTPEMLPEISDSPKAYEDDLMVEVMNLPIKIREVVLLYYYQNMDTNEIAKCWGWRVHPCRQDCSGRGRNSAIDWKGWIPMKEIEQRQMVRDAIDHRLSGLQGNPRLAQIIIAKSKGEPPVMKKKLSVGLILALLIVLIATAALAAGILFSPRYDAAKLANKAMLDTYGITEKMMTVFYREVKQDDGASATVTYASVEGIEQLGVYTVTVKDGRANASWSFDGTDTSGGLAAKAWGTEQVEMLVTDYAKTMQFLYACATPPLGTDAEALLTAPPLTREEYQRAAEENKANAMNAAKITLTQAKEIALEALEHEYALSDAQVNLFQIMDEDATYKFEDGKPTVSLYCHLTQGREWMDKDGIYVVTVNLATGVIEDILYDSGLAGNG